MSTATLPDVLSEPARSFAAGPHRLLIGGERLEAADGRTFETVDPSTGRTIAEVAYAGTEDVDRAVRVAREAFEDGRWSGIAAAARTRAMLALADAIEAHADELAELESLDNGKPVKLAKRVDVHLAVEHLRYFAGWPTKIAGATLPVAQPDMHCYTRKEPATRSATGARAARGTASSACRPARRRSSRPGTRRSCSRRGRSRRRWPRAARSC